MNKSSCRTTVYRFIIISFFFLILLPDRLLAQEADLKYKLVDFEWSLMVVENGQGQQVKKTKPTTGYVKFADGSLKVGTIKVKTVDGEISKITLQEGKKTKALDIPSIVDLGILGSPTQISADGRKSSPDPSLNFNPVSFGNKKGFGLIQTTEDGKSSLLFSESMSAPVVLIPTPEDLKTIQDKDLVYQLNALPANERIKYGIICANGIQIAYDGENRSGMGLKVLKNSYDKAEYHLRESSKAIFNGKNGYASFMLGKCAVEYLVPETGEDEIDFEASRRNFKAFKSGGPKGTGYFVISILDGLNKDAFSTVDYWVMVDYLNTYALFAQTRGKHAMAQDLYEYAIKIARQYLHPDAELLIAVNHNYALLQFDLGNFKDAALLLNKTYNNIIRIKGRESRVTLIAQVNKAMIQAKLGRYKKARQDMESLMVKSVEILPEYGIDAERIRLNIGFINHLEERFPIALSNYEKALEGIELKGKSRMPDFDELNLLKGSILLEKLKGGTENKDEILSDLLEIRKKISKKYPHLHSLQAEAMMLLGNYFCITGDLKKAKEQVYKANQIHEYSLGTRSYKYLESSGFLSLLEWKSGMLDSAQLRMTEVASTFLQLKDAVFSSMSENQREEFWKNIRPHIDLFSAFAAANPTNGQIVKDAFNFRLKTKGLLFSTSSQLIKRAMFSEDAGVRKLFSEWKQLREELLSSLNTDKNERENKADTPEEIKDRISEVEQQLANKVKLTGLPSESATFNLIRTKLEEGESLVEIVKIIPDGVVDTISSYFAYVVRKADAAPVVIQLGTGEDLDKRFYRNYINKIKYKIDDRSSYKNYWQPLEAVLKNSKKIFFVNDGIYNQINISGILNTDNQKLLADEYHIVLLTVPGNLLNENLETNTDLSSSNVFLLGGPEFGAGLSQLPGALEELQSVQKILADGGSDPTIITGAEADESHLKTVDGNNKIIHIATHGYFVQARRISKNASTLMQRPDFRSGLILSGAKVSDFQGIDDGYFPAYEAANLNLSNVELVILSACETGLGEVVTGESVQGLARSFRVAGAKKVIMSLWKVDDEATKLLMTRFYEELLKGTSYSSAFIRSQKSLRSNTKFSHPYYWSAFVLLD